MENTTRRLCMNLNGLTGFFIAVILLLSILGFLTYLAITTQQATAVQSYELKDPLTIKRIAPNLGNENHIVIHGEAVGGDSAHKYKFEK